MWHKQSFTQFWSQSDAYSRKSSLKLTYIHHPLVVCTHQICCAVAVPIALSQDRLLHGHNRLVNWTPCSRRRESKLKMICCIHSCQYCWYDAFLLQVILIIILALISLWMCQEFSYNIINKYEWWLYYKYLHWKTEKNIWAMLLL